MQTGRINGSDNSSVSRPRLAAKTRAPFQHSVTINTTGESGDLKNLGSAPLTAFVLPGVDRAPDHSVARSTRECHFRNLPSPLASYCQPPTGCTCQLSTFYPGSNHPCSFETVSDSDQVFRRISV
jgi:hypothetical protein